MDLITIAISTLLAVIGGVMTLRSQAPKKTIDSQNALIETYEKRFKILEDQKEEDRKQHLANVKAIAELQGQISVYKDLPLQSLATSMSEIAESNARILSILSHSEITQTKTILKTV